MKRRTILRGAGTATAGLLAGCVGSDGPGDGSSDSPTDSATASPTDSPTESPPGSSTDSPTPGEPATLADSSFEVRSNECGSMGNDARLKRAEDREVVLAGRIDGADTCHTARLVDASLSADSDTLDVSVETYVPESDGTAACGQCIVEIRYDATFTFDGGRPDRAVVSHDGERVAEIPFPE